MDYLQLWNFAFLLRLWLLNSFGYHLQNVEAET